MMTNYYITETGTRIEMMPTATLTTGTCYWGPSSEPFKLSHFLPAEEEYVSNKVKVEKGAYQFFAKNYTDEQEQAIRKWCRSQGKGRVHCRKDANALWITFKAADDGLATMFQLQFKE